MTSFPPPLSAGFEFGFTFNFASLPLAVYGNRSKRLCLAARNSAVRDRSSIMSWSLSNAVRSPSVRYCRTSSATTETALYSRFSRGVGKRGRKGKRTPGITSIRFSRATNVQPQPFATIYYVQLVAVKWNWMRATNLNFARSGVEAGHAHGCTCSLDILAKEKKA